MNATGDEVPTAMTLKPSLRAAMDAPVKVLGAVTSVLLPVVIPAAIEGESIGAAVFFFGIEAFALYPALAAALVPAVQLAFTTYTFEEDGLVVRTQILARSERRVPWEKVTALRHRRTLLDVVFRIERLDVIAYGERGTTLRLVGLRDAAPLRSLVARRMRETSTVEALLRSD